MKKHLIYLLFAALLIISSMAASQTVQVSLKAFLEGPYDAGAMSADLNPQYIPLQQPYNVPPWNYPGTESIPAIPNGDVVDWILVELRETAGDATTAYSDNVVAIQAGFILKDGQLVSTDGLSPLTFTLTVTYKIFAVIYHRNHLTVMSAMELTEAGGIYTYDFSAGASQVYGGSLAQKEVEPGIWGMIAGDADANGQVNTVDKNDVWILQAGMSGYYAGDFDMNGQVNNVDKNDLWIVNGGRSAQIPGVWECGLPLLVSHAGGDVAPVNKTVHYGTVLTNLTGEDKCWITQNLGADQQATSASDITEESAGWYWQFNRKQGYKHDGTTRTPNSPWINSINENSDWQVANDPCAILPGSGWRLPTFTEWLNADQNGNWNNYNDAFSSELKLHAAGYLNPFNGSLDSRGSYGLYWSSTQVNNTEGWLLIMYNNYSNTFINTRVHGFSGRCLRD